jgi:hypothetical protein
VADKNSLGFVRAYFEDRILCLFNRDTRTSTTGLEVAPELKDGTYLDELSGKQIEVSSGNVEITLEPRSAAFFSAAQKQAN